ncbi:hypothetical protein Hanom_Chr04g00287831 [Helianthus anomalus]
MLTFNSITFSNFSILIKSAGKRYKEIFNNVNLCFKKIKYDLEPRCLANNQPSIFKPVDRRL